MILSDLPWWVKLAAKAGLSLVPVPYERIRYLLTGYRGGMEETRYATDVFKKYIREYDYHSNSSHGSLLELGPGGSLLSGIYGRSYGFDNCVLVDVGDFASKDLQSYSNMMNNLNKEDQERFFSGFQRNNDLYESFKLIGISYLTKGLSSLKEISNDSINFSFSNAVLEHIRLGEFQNTTTELYRIHKPGSKTCHQIDYKDHLALSLNNMRFPTKVWEHPLFPNSGFYTNRLRHSHVKQSFINSGFIIEQERLDRWETIPLAKDKLSSEFHDISEEDLSIKGAFIIARKPD